MNRVKELRLLSGMQQKEVAVAIGVSRPTVSEWEHQKKDPTGERLMRLADLFDVPPSFILHLFISVFGRATPCNAVLLYIVDLHDMAQHGTG